MKAFYHMVLCLFLLAGLSACGTNYRSDEYKFANLSAYQNKLTRAHAAMQVPAPKIYFLGLSLWGGEDWSENDVLFYQELTQQIYPDYQLVDFHFSNRETELPTAHPSFDRGLIESVQGFIKSHISKDDILVIAYSSHGWKNLVAARIGTSKITPLRASYFAELSNGFQGFDTIILANSCYSGSLIDNLARPHVAIITSAREDRKSFGCDVGSTNTYFSLELQQELEAQKRAGQPLNWRLLFEGAKARVTTREKQEKRVPSEPQIFIGDKINENKLYF